MMSLFMLAAIASSPDLGKAEGQCRAREQGPAFLVDVLGLKDRDGNLKLELYPANDKDFLADDNVLLMAGKPFRRVEVDVPASGAVQLCIRAPAAGTYALSLLHDRDSNRKMGLSVDGIGFPGNPKLCWGQPKSKDARATVGNGPTRIAVTMQYRRNLVCFGPIQK
ncbi:MAG: DUF2141 domain-containing protein [Sphingobium sp.]